MFRIAKLQIVKDITRWSAGTLLIYLLLSMVIQQLGIEKVKTFAEQEKEFAELHVKKVASFINYQQYGVFGIDRLLLGSKIFSLFYNSSTFDALQAKIEISTQYNVYKPELGKNVFDRPTGGNLDFSWFLIFFGTALYSLWAFFLFRNLDYLRFLKDFAGDKQVYFGTILGRAMVVILSLFIVLLTVLVQFRVNGITLKAADLSGLLISFATAAVVMLILTGLISAFGAIRNWKKGVTLAIVSWIFLVLLGPELLNSVFSWKAEVKMKSIIAQQIKKNEIYYDFEKKTLENTGRYESIPEKKEADRKSAEHYWKVISKKILAIDNESIDQTTAISRDFHKWSVFNPVTFYKSMNNELGGKGFNAYNRFYHENLEIQRKFLRFVFDKRYYENYARVDPYLPGPALVVRSSPTLPAYFSLGCLVLLFYLAAVYLFAYIMYRKTMYPAARAPGGYEAVNIDAEYGRAEWITGDEQDLYDQVYKVFSGCPRGFNGHIAVGNKSMVNEEKNEVVFVPRQDHIPGHFTTGFIVNNLGKTAGVRAEILERFKTEKKDLLKKRLAQLAPVDRTVLLMDICGLKGAKIYLSGYLGNFGDAQTKLNRKIRQLKEKGILILCLSEIFAKPDKYYIYVLEGKTYVTQDWSNDKESSS